MIVYNGRHIGSPIKEFTATSKPGKELKKFTITAKEYEGRVANSADMRIMVSAVSDGATHKDNNSGTFPLGGNGKKKTVNCVKYRIQYISLYTISQSIYNISVYILGAKTRVFLPSNQRNYSKKSIQLTYFQVRNSATTTRPRSTCLNLTLN